MGTALEELGFKKGYAKNATGHQGTRTTPGTTDNDRITQLKQDVESLGDPWPKIVQFDGNYERDALIGAEFGRRVVGGHLGRVRFSGKRCSLSHGV